MFQPVTSKNLLTPTERCDKHSQYYIDMYCQNHDDVGCAICMAVDHRSCQATFYIPEFLQKSQISYSDKEILQKLERVDKNLKDYYTNLQQQKQRILKEKMESLEKIRKFKKEINTRLFQLEKSSTDEVENIYKMLTNQIEDALKVMHANKVTVKSARERLLSPGNNVSQAFVNVKKGNQVATIAAECTLETKARIQEVNIDFKADQRLPELLEEMKSFGTSAQGNMNRPAAPQKSAKMSAVPRTNIDTDVQQQSSPANQTDTLLKVKGKKIHSVKVKTDKLVCDTVSTCALEDGTIILSDYNNMKLKRLDSSTFSVIDYCDLPHNPWQVCPISKQEVAVSLTGKKEVAFISVGSSMSQTNEIKTDFNCFGLAYANGNLYISDYTSVYIYSLTGRKLKHFKKHQSGQKLFSDIRSLAVSKDGSKIYVSDFNKGLTVLDSSGQVVGKYSRLLLKDAWGCYLTETGSLLVCRTGSHNVLQFGADGELIGEVLKSDIYARYQAVCCNKQMSKMILSSQNDTIEVYDFT